VHNDALQQRNSSVVPLADHGDGVLRLPGCAPLPQGNAARVRDRPFMLVDEERAGGGTVELGARLML
jgi:hypothetical protein